MRRHSFRTLMAATARLAITPGRVFPGWNVPVTLRREQLLSFYYCSAYGFRSGSRVLSNGDIARVGGC